MKYPFVGSALVGSLVLVSSTVAQSGSLMFERLDHYQQTSAASPVVLASGEYQFQVRIQGNGTDMSTWDPAFYKPGTNATPSETFSAFTNTGTNNFTSTVNGVATPNDGGNYRFQNNFGSNGALMDTFYPAGQYGIIFNGLAGATATTGLVYDAAVTYPSVAPQVTGMNNGAFWSSGLVVSTSGQTQLFFNSTSFAGYASNTYGALIEVSLYNSFGSEIAFYKSVNVPSLDFTDAPLTNILIDGSSLIAGQTYTLEIQYGLVASTPGLSTLGGLDFISAAIYYKNTAISLTAAGAPIPEPSTYASVGALVLLTVAVFRRSRARV